MSKKIDFGSDEEFIEKYNELKSAAKVGEYYGCSKNPVLRHAAEIGYDINSNKNYKLSAQDKEDIIAAYNIETSTSLAAKYGVSRGMITKVWYDANLSGKTRDNSNQGSNLIGQKFGYLEVIDFSSRRNASGGKFWVCKCSCGKEGCLNTKEIDGQALLHGKTISCGCIGKENLKIGQGLNFKDLTGQRFGKLIVLNRASDKTFSNSYAVQWECKCDCGRTTKVLASNLTGGNTQSCGLCKENSHGNIKIENLLKQYNIPYEREKRFDTCRDTLPLPFDFYVDNKYLIEYDGRQHFEQSSLYDYESTKKHDIIKSQWCKDNNILLIRIPYTRYDELNINDLLIETSNFIEK